MNGNRKNKDFTRSRVTEIKGMQVFYCSKIRRLTTKHKKLFHASFGLMGIQTSSFDYYVFKHIYDVA
jgi:hypothetical protein